MKIVIENHDAPAADAVARLLREDGHDVAVCSGPERGGATCPLVDDRDCELLASADVVLYDLDLGRSDDRTVLAATRRRYPALPLVAQVSTSQQRRYADLLRGVQATVPYSPEHLRDAVLAATDDRGTA